jgi:hypothetical protein
LTGRIESIEFRAAACPTCESIVAPILTMVEGCVWAFEGGAPFSSQGPLPFPDDEELVSLFDVPDEKSDRAVWDLGWLRSNGIRRMLPFVHSDWLSVYAVIPPPFPRDWVGAEAARPPLSNLRGLALYLDCVDGAFWRAWSPLEPIMSALRSDPRARTGPSSDL